MMIIHPCHEIIVALHWGEGVLCGNLDVLQHPFCNIEPALQPAAAAASLHYVISSSHSVISLLHEHVPCGLRGRKNRPAPFPGRMSYKAKKPGSVCPLLA